MYPFTSTGGDGRVVQRCCVAYVTRGVQLILAYSWARPAILVAGKGRGGIFYFFYFFTFIPVPLSSLSIFFISSTISSVSFLPFSGRQHKMTHKGWRVVKPQHNKKSITSIGINLFTLNQSTSCKTTKYYYSGCKSRRLCAITNGWRFPVFRNQPWPT